MSTKFDSMSREELVTTCQGLARDLWDTNTRLSATTELLERLRAELQDGDDADAGMRDLCGSLKSRLSTATELLGRWMAVTPPRNVGGRSASVVSDTRAFLQTTAPAPTEREKAERKVKQPECIGCAEGFESNHPCQRTCKGCLEGIETNHTCQRAVIPPQTWVPPSGRREAKP